MDDIEEKRVYAEQSTGTEAFVASSAGVVRVGVADDRVGEFSIAHSCTARDVALAPELAVATDEDVLYGPSFDPTGFGPAVAVGADGGDLLAAGEDGTVARREGEEWVDLGAVGEARALDGGLLAAADGVYRVGDDVEYAGLDDVRDVAAAGPLAATGTGLFRLGNGWLEDLSGPFRAVSADGARAHAATEDALYAADGAEWTAVDLPVDEAVADAGYADDCAYAVTTAGTFLADAGDGWRSRHVGVPDVAALAVRGRGKRV